MEYQEKCESDGLFQRIWSLGNIGVYKIITIIIIIINIDYTFGVIKIRLYHGWAK